MRSVDIDLIFLPQFEPFQPYLAGAMLQAALNREGLTSRYHDLNLSYYRHIIGDASEQLQPSPDGQPFDYEPYSRTIASMQDRLNAHSLDGLGIGFYETAFGELLYRADGLLQLADGRWGRSFQDFIHKQSSELDFDSNTSFVGVILVVHDQLPAAILLSRYLRDASPHLHICWGGPLISRIGIEILNERPLNPFFDSLVMGAGEAVLPRLVQSVSRGARPETMPGVLFSRETPPNKVGLAPPIGDFLLPDFAEYPIDRYLSPKRVLPYLTSRGCYWGKCEFCCHYRPFEQYETSNIAHIADQLEWLSERYDVRHFSFSDEAVPVATLKKLALEIIRRGLDIRWFTFARMEAGFDHEACKLLYRAGCRILMFGFESVVQRVVDSMQKGTSVKNVVPILSACKESGISIRLDVLIGFPSETRDESEKTLDFLLEHEYLIDTPFSVTPLSKFELHGDAPMRAYLERFGVESYGPLRGPLDYQHRYSVSSGMAPEEAERQYRRYIEIISKEFRAHARMPENKTHAFLMKSSYSDTGQESRLFEDEISPTALDQYWFSGLDRLTLRATAEGSWVIQNRKNGAKVKVGKALGDIVGRLRNDGQLKTAQYSVNATEKIARFLTYLQRQGFLEAHSKEERSQTTLLRV